MRTLLLFAPALICSGAMIVCLRMMSGRHHGADVSRAQSDREVVDPAEPDAAGQPQNR
jgi:hypothetical protein